MNCGIYEIVHVQTGFRYIGMSQRIKERRTEHLRRLKAGKHHCMLLQLAWKRYGERAFVFRGLESITRSTTREFLFQREKAWRVRYSSLLFNPLKGQKAAAVSPSALMESGRRRSLNDLRGPAAVAACGLSPPRVGARRDGVERRRGTGRRADDPA